MTNIKKTSEIKNKFALGDDEVENIFDIFNMHSETAPCPGKIIWLELLISFSELVILTFIRFSDRFRDIRVISFQVSLTNYTQKNQVFIFHSLFFKVLGETKHHFGDGLTVQGTTKHLVVIGRQTIQTPAGLGSGNAWSGVISLGQIYIQLSNINKQSTYYNKNNLQYNDPSSMAFSMFCFTDCLCSAV